MRRFSAVLIAALFAACAFAPATFAASTTTNLKPVPRVVFIVGPAGPATDGYRAQARAAAAIARKYTPDVTELYSPDATWPAVKQALAGASLVVYMGHGNGWPSKYRDELYPPTQDGFGLNPKAGGSDSTHQYFGEASVGSQIKLAKNAVVLLNHLCYASGNSEPGLPEGNLDQARQRVDNYAAGFIRAGASAVVAEAWSSPSYFVKAILGGGRSIQNAWQNAPSANGHRLAFESQRSPGYVAQMDTERSSSGFTRSVVMKTGLAPRDVLAGAVGSARSFTARAGNTADPAIPAVPLDPTLIGSGLQLGAPDIKDLPSAGTAVRVNVPFKIKDRKSLPKGIEASVRWDPIDVAIVPADPAAEVGAAAPAASTATPGATPAAPTASRTPDLGVKPDAPAVSKPDAVDPAGVNAATPARPRRAGSVATPAAGADATTPAAGADATTPAADPDTAAPALNTGLADPTTALDTPPAPDTLVEAPAAGLDLIVPEQLGDIVSPAAVKFTKTQMWVPVTMPSAQGRYRLTITLHDAEGVAYDAATQALIPSLIVRVTGDFDGAILAAPTAQLVAGSHVDLGLRVVNLGLAPWGHVEAAVSASDFVTGRTKILPANIVGRWIPLSAYAALPADPADQTVTAPLPIGFAPGVPLVASLGFTAPAAAGEYILLLDVVTPELGSLVASGAAPTLVRVTVQPTP